MRDVLVVLGFVVVALLALRRPFYGALLWTWFGLMNPHRLAFGFASTLPFAQTSVVVIGLAMLLHPKEVRWPRGAPIVLLIILVAWMTLTTSMSMLPDLSWRMYREVMKVLVMTVVVASLIRTREHIVALVWTLAISIGFFGVKGGLFTLMTGGSFRVWGPPGTVVEGNNELAVALVMTVPLLYFLATRIEIARDFRLVSRLPVKTLRAGLFVSMMLCAVAAIGSQSRGAFLAIAAMSAMLWWRSHTKVSLAIALVLGVFVALPLMPDAWFERMDTIRTYDEDLSALGRLNAWKMAINIANHRVLGVGFATANPIVFDQYAEHTGPGWILVAHSIYFEMMGQHGYVGLVIYVLLGLSIYRNAGALVRLGRRRADLAWLDTLGNMTKVSLVGFAVGGAFLSLAYWDMPYYLMVVVLAARRWGEAELAKAPPAATGDTAAPRSWASLPRA